MSKNLPVIEIAAKEAQDAYKAQKTIDDAEDLAYFSERWAVEKAENDARWEKEEAAQKEKEESNK